VPNTNGEERIICSWGQSPQTPLGEALLAVVETPGLDLTRRLLRIAPRGVPLPAAAAAFLRLLDARAPPLIAPAGG
jgi:hypothetical protein